jgi:ankyrin repeat protein
MISLFKPKCIHRTAVDCDCTVIDNEGKTALHWTVTNKDPNCILALVEAYPPLLNRRYISTEIT